MSEDQREQEAREQLAAIERAIEERIFADKTPTERDTLLRARAFGIDLTLLLENLALSPTERLLKFESALAFVLELQSSMRALHAKRT